MTGYNKENDSFFLVEEGIISLINVTESMRIIKTTWTQPRKIFEHLDNVETIIQGIMLSIKHLRHLHA